MGENLSQQVEEAAQTMAIPEDNDAMLNRIGHVTRTLHDSLVDLGFDKILDEVTQNIPDARDRLDYVTQKTQEAADKVLNATDVAIPIQDELQQEAKKLEAKLLEIQSKKTLKSGYDEGVSDVLEFLALSNQRSDQTKALLMEIMMAQDFQDLTGQVVKKITSLAQSIETQLVQMLLDFAPEDKTQNVAPKKVENTQEKTLVNGPQIHQDAEGIVTDQEQVDDLLDSLGF